MCAMGVGMIKPSPADDNRTGFMCAMAKGMMKPSPADDIRTGFMCAMAMGMMKPSLANACLALVFIPSSNNRIIILFIMSYYVRK
jgi:hypothetical protein